MAITTLQRKLTTAINKAQVQPPWNHLARHTAYEAKYEYPLRPGTMRTAIKLYGPILQAASLFNRESADQSLPYQNVFAEPYCMILRKTGKSTVTILETPLADGTTFLVACTGDTLRISVVETDGTRLPSVKFSDMDDHALGMIALAILPHIINVDITDGNGKLSEAIADIGKCLDDAGRDVWNSEAEIPDLAKDSAYFLDAAMCILKDKMVIDCGNNSADTPAEMEAFYFSNSDALTGALMCSYAGPNNWAPQFVHPTGNATLFASSQITIKDAKATFASYSAARNWTPQEKALIPVFDDDMPVMPETLRIANRIVNTRNDTNPVCNVMWRGVTSYGKSTGVRQLACILNVPLLILTCHPSMEASEFKSQFVPNSNSDDLLVDMNQLLTPKKASMTETFTPPFFDEAMQYVQALDNSAKMQLLDGSVFFQDAFCDTESAVQRLLGRYEELDVTQVCWLYAEVCNAIRQAPMKTRIAELEAAMPDADNSESKPDFVHVLSPYVKAMTNGYLVEIQEASRIRDSGVLVSINEFDRPNAVLPLMNGYSAIRHKDALCIITDNVGYSSCRPIDPSVLRRQGMIIDSYELTKERLLERVRRNTGVTDSNLLERCYHLWETVKFYCEQNSIAEGSVSPMELERFVQAVKYDGPDSIDYNLDDCVISKATSSIEDQRDIRTACQTIT